MVKLSKVNKIKEQYNKLEKAFTNCEARFFYACKALTNINILKYVQKLGAGLDCVPFGFHYGNARGSSLTGEAALGVKYMHTYGKYCANMEADWDGQGWPAGIPEGHLADIAGSARPDAGGVEAGSFPAALP